MAQKRNLELKKKKRKRSGRINTTSTACSRRGGKYKDADHRCEELGIRIREKKKAEKYQELEKLKKSWKQSKESLKQSVKKREGYFRRAALTEKDEEEKNAFQYWQM